MKAFLKNYRQAPRKVRLIANHIRGKRVPEAVADLSFMPQKAAGALLKLLNSAVANAQQKDGGLKADDLKIATITVDKGITYVRYMPRAFGRAAPIHKECSHIYLELAQNGARVSGAEKGEKAGKAPADKKAKPASAKAAAGKKAPAKKKAASKKTK